MATLGYIIQYSNEDDYTVYHGFMKLYRHFSDALEHARKLYHGFLEINPPGHNAPLQIHTPTKRECDTQGSVIVFESPSYIVWIDCVVE